MRNFVPMKRYLLLIVPLSAILFSACKKSAADMPKLHFKIDTKCPVTPVKSQGKGQTCWIYAMLATIESNRLTMGDSVNLSPTYLERMLLQKETEKVFRSKGEETISMRGMIPYCMQLIKEFGAFNFDSYYCKNEEFSWKDNVNELQKIAERTANEGGSLDKLRKEVKELLDREISFLPKNQYFMGAGYTPQEFGRSVALFEHYDFFGADYKFPDRRESDKIKSTPPGKLLRLTEESINKGYAVCWEGDISEDGFCWEAGLAITDTQKVAGSTRQESDSDFNKKYEEDIEDGDTTDDHCLAICGIAHDEFGRKYFLCKNSWGTKNRYKGFLFMSYDYFLAKTLVVGVYKDIGKRQRANLFKMPE